MSSRPDDPSLFPATPSTGVWRASDPPDEASYRAFFQQVPVGIYRSTPDGRLLAGNPTLVTMLGYPSFWELLSTNTVEMYVDPADRLRWREIMERDGVVTEFDTRKRRKDGSVIWLRDNARVVRRPDGEILYYEGAVIDITGQKDAEESVRRSEQRFRALVESIPDTILRVGEDGVCVDVAEGQTRVVGSDAAMGRSLAEIFFEPVANQFLEAVDRTRSSGERVSFEYEGGDGRHYEARVSRGGRGDALILLRDVEESFRIRAHLMRSERLASVGVLAAGVAHEINNPLSYVNTNLEFVRGTLERLLGSLPTTGTAGELSPELLAALMEGHEAIAEALEGTGRVRHIVQELKGFSRNADDAPTAVELHRVLDSSLKLVANEIRHRARLVVSLGDLPPVHGNATRLGQIFVNLLLNAAQSIVDGDADRNEIRVAGHEAPGGRVVVEISDTGGGIPADAIERIFDPFFTTKPVGLGTGLGLAVCHNIVTSYGGEISVESREGQGTTFRIWLLTGESPVATSTPAPANAAEMPRARVLVIDDEPLIGRAMRRNLSRHFDVEALESARDALERIGAGERWDVIICDMMMPVMSGMELYGELLDAHPELARRVVFMTGGAFTERTQVFLDGVDNPILEKPTPLREIRAVIAAMCQPLSED